MKLMGACCLLFGFEENWENGKKYLLNDIKFLTKLIEFDVSKAPNDRFEKLREGYLNDI